MADDNSPENLRYEIDRHEDDIGKLHNRINKLEKDAAALRELCQSYNALIHLLLVKSAVTIPPYEEYQKVLDLLHTSLEKARNTLLNQTK